MNAEQGIGAGDVARHVERLAGTIGERNVARPQALAAARDYLEEVLRGEGYAVRRQEYRAAGVLCANLEASLAGGARADQILLLGAHYDSVAGSPGANDNASGVAALLEIARRFAGTEPALTVRFLAFVNEEPPFFMTARQGSVVYASAARRRGDDIRLMIALETIGYYTGRPGSQRYPPLLGRFYPDRGDFLALISDLRSLPVVRQMARVFRRHSGFPLEYAGLPRCIPGVSWSDHLSFWRRGYPAVMATDTAFLRYPYYHSADDTPEKLDMAKLAAASEALYRCCAALAGEGAEALR